MGLGVFVVVGVLGLRDLRADGFFAVPFVAAAFEDGDFPTHDPDTGLALSPAFFVGTGAFF